MLQYQNIYNYIDTKNMISKKTIETVKNPKFVFVNYVQSCYQFEEMLGLKININCIQEILPILEFEYIPKNKKKEVEEDKKEEDKKEENEDKKEENEDKKEENEDKIQYNSNDDIKKNIYNYINDNDVAEFNAKKLFCIFELSTEFSL